MKRAVPRLQGNARAVAKGELIGQDAKIAHANDAGIVGLAGTIVDETLHTLTLRLGPAGSRRVQIAKVGTTFEIRGELIDGAALEFRSWDRTKKVK